MIRYEKIRGKRSAKRGNGDGLMNIGLGKITHNGQMTLILARKNREIEK